MALVLHRGAGARGFWGIFAWRFWGSAGAFFVVEAQGFVRGRGGRRPVAQKQGEMPAWAAGGAEGQEGGVLLGGNR
jgi:hypothetical protein